MATRLKVGQKNKGVCQLLPQKGQRSLTALPCFIEQQYIGAGTHRRYFLLGETDNFSISWQSKSFIKHYFGNRIAMMKFVFNALMLLVVVEVRVNAANYLCQSPPQSCTNVICYGDYHYEVINNGNLCTCSSACFTQLPSPSNSAIVLPTDLSDTLWQVYWVELPAGKQVIAFFFDLCFVIIP